MTDQQKFTSGERVWVRGAGLATYEYPYNATSGISMVLFGTYLRDSPRNRYPFLSAVPDSSIIKLADIERVADQASGEGKAATNQSVVRGRLIQEVLPETNESKVYFLRDDDRTTRLARVLVPVECPSKSSAVGIDGMTLNADQLDTLWRYFLRKADVL